MKQPVRSWRSLLVTEGGDVAAWPWARAESHRAAGAWPGASSGQAERAAIRQADRRTRAAHARLSSRTHGATAPPLSCERVRGCREEAWHGPGPAGRGTDAPPSAGGPGQGSTRCSHRIGNAGFGELGSRTPAGGGCLRMGEHTERFENPVVTNQMACSLKWGTYTPVEDAGVHAGSTQKAVLAGS